MKALLRELALQSLSLACGGVWNTLSLLRRPLRGNRRRVLLAGTNLMMARELSEVRSLLETDARIEMFAAVRPFAGVAGGVDPARFAAAVGVNAVSSAGIFLQPWDLIILSAHARAFNAGRLVPRVFTGHGISSWKVVDGEIDEFRGYYTRCRGRWVYSRMFMRGEDAVRVARGLHPELGRRTVACGDIVVDDLLAAAEHRAQLRERLGYRPEDRVVAVLSTHGPQGLLGSWGRRTPQALRSLAERFRVILVNHPLNIYHEAYGDLRRLSVELRDSPPAGVHVNQPEDPIQPALIAADLAVTDHTSTALYFAQLGKPIVAVKTPGYEAPEGSPWSRILKFVPSVRRPEDVAAAAEAAFTEFPLERLSGIACDVVSFPGAARTHWRDELYALLNLTPPPMPAMWDQELSARAARRLVGKSPAAGRPLPASRTDRGDF